MPTPAEQHIQVIAERKTYLDARIEAKQKVGWEFQWDERERNALAWAIDELSSQLKGERPSKS